MATPNHDFLRDYQKLAEASFEPWRALWSNARTAAPAGAGATPGMDVAFDRMLDGLKNYCTWLETLSAASAAAPGGLRFDQAFGKAFDGRAAEPFFKAFAASDALGFGDPEFFAKSMRAFAEPAEQALRGWLDLPAFGLDREQQEKAQAYGRAWLDYLDESARYQNIIGRIGRLAAERLQEKLADREGPGRQVESLRALYDLWVDAAEEIYAEIALTDEFREVYGAMVNAQMRVRKLAQKKVEELGTSLGMPTRSEVDTLGRRVQELRRGAAAADLQPLRDEIASLRRELDALRKSTRERVAPSAKKPAEAAPAKRDAGRAAPAVKGSKAGKPTRRT